MKRSSWIVLGAAAIILAVSTAFYLSLANRQAPPLTPRVVAGLVDEGKRALERRDPDAIMELMTPEARVLGRRLEPMRAIIRRAFDELQTPLTVKTGKVALKSEGGEHTATFAMEIGQQTSGMTAVYYPGLRVHLHLQKVRTPHWLGLFTVEEWRISQFDCEPPIEASYTG
jgi:hypothetical protein